MKEIYVLGHKNPDTDSICSAIAYAYLKNQISDREHIAKRAGAINPETEYVLKYFDVKDPELVEDLREQISDIEYEKRQAVVESTPLKKAWEILNKERGFILPIVDENERMKGIISLGDINKTFIRSYDSSVISAAKTPLENILETINGDLVCGDKEYIFEEGNVIIATHEKDLLSCNCQKGDIVIVKDSKSAQTSAIINGAACIIVCSNNVDDKIRKLANENNCIVIKCKDDVFEVARNLNQSIPVGYFMIKKDLITFSPADIVDEIKDSISETRHREFPLIEEDRYCGILKREDFVEPRKKEVILVDHNEKNQAVNGCKNAKILEIVDHHKVGKIETAEPIFYRNMTVGCTSTIIYTIFKEYGVEIPKHIAGLMCSAILSDTLLFKSPTCTELDKKAAEELANIAKINIQEYALAMFEAGSDFGSKTEKEIFNLDYKRFTAGDITYGVGQVSSVSKAELDKMKEKMLKYMQSVVENESVDMVYLMLTDILEEASDLLCVGQNAVATAQKAFGVEAKDNVLFLKGAVSRKKQIIPQLTEVLNK